MTFQTSSNDLLTLTKYLVSATASEGKFTTIQSAITQAVADGASLTDQKLIIVKPGTYTEDITLADGINISSLLFDGSRNLTEDIGVIIDGSLTLSSGTTRLQGICIKRSSGSSFLIASGNLYLDSCEVVINTGAGFALTTAGAKNITLQNSLIKEDATATLMTHDGSNATVVYESYDSSYVFANSATTISGANGDFSIKHLRDSVVNSYNISIPTLAFSVDFSGAQQISGTYFLTTGGSTTGNGDFRYSTFNTGSDDLFTIGNAGFLLSTYHCLSQRTTWEDFNIAASQTLDTQVIEYASGTTSNDTGIAFNAKRTGYEKTEERKTQGFVQTTDATATTIWSYTLETNQGVTIQAQISGKISDSSAYCGGNIVGCARRAGAGAVLVSTASNVLEDSGGAPTFAINVNGNDVRLQVTGRAAETWNWAATITYQRIEANT